VKETEGRVASLREAQLSSGFLKRTPAYLRSCMGFDNWRILMWVSRVCQETICDFPNWFSWKELDDDVVQFMARQSLPLGGVARVHAASIYW